MGRFIASFADVVLARHAFLPNERLLKRAAHSFPFVPVHETFQSKNHPKDCFLTICFGIPRIHLTQGGNCVSKCQGVQMSITVYFYESKYFGEPVGKV